MMLPPPPPQRRGFIFRDWRLLQLRWDTVRTASVRIPVYRYQVFFHTHPLYRAHFCGVIVVPWSKRRILLRCWRNQIFEYGRTGTRKSWLDLRTCLDLDMAFGSNFPLFHRVPAHPGKSWNLRKNFPGLESHGKCLWSWKVIEFHQ